MPSNHSFLKKLIFSFAYTLQIPTYAFKKNLSNYNTATFQMLVLSPSPPPSPSFLPVTTPFPSAQHLRAGITRRGDEQGVVSLGLLLLG